MTYGFCPENWPAFQAELRKRGIAVADIERVDIRPELAPRAGRSGPGREDPRRDRAREAPTGMIRVTLTLRSGQVESWRQPQAEGAR